jgi:hypothetical protein
MSGGALDYAYVRIEELAFEIRRRATDPLHRALAEHLQLVAKAAQDLEWVWSGDSSSGKEMPAIMAVISPKAQLDSALGEAEDAIDNLRKAIKRAEEV